MSSMVKWGGIAGVVAAALLIMSAILYQLNPVQRTYDSTASYVYLGVVLAAYIAVIVAVLGIHALHGGTPRYGRLGTAGTVLTIAGYAIIAVMTVISMVQGYASLLTVRLAGAGALLVGSVLLGVIILRAGCCPGGAACCSSWLSRWAISRTRSSVLPRICCWHCSGALWALLYCRREGVVNPAATQPAEAG